MGSKNLCFGTKTGRFGIDARLGDEVVVVLNFLFLNQGALWVIGYDQELLLGHLIIFSSKIIFHLARISSSFYLEGYSFC